MGSSPPLVALDVKQPESPLDTYSRIIGLQNMVQQGQGQKLQQQLLGSQLQDEQAGRAMLGDLASKAQDSGQSPTPQDIYKLAGKYGASINAANAITNGLLAQQEHVSNIAKNDAATNASNLETQQKLNDAYRGRIMSIVNGPEADKQTNWANEIAKDEQAGAIKPGTFSNIYPGDSAAQALADHFALGSVLAKEATEKMSATGSYLRGATAANEFAAKTNPRSPLYSPSPAAVAMGSAPGAQQIQAGQSAQAGRVAGAEAAAKQPYEIQIQQIRQQGEMQVEQVRQQVSQQMGISKDATDKIEMNVLKPYQDKMNEVSQLQSAIQQAQNGNVTAARGVLLKLIGVSNPDGTKRFNNQEAERLLSQGNIGQRFAGSIKNLLTGNNWTDQMASDMQDFATAQASVAGDSLNRGIQNVNKLYGTSVGTGLLQTGTGNTAPGAANAGPAPNVGGIPPKLPPGATHIVPGPDGRRHYTNAQGTVDYGIAP